MEISLEKIIQDLSTSNINLNVDNNHDNFENNDICNKCQEKYMKLEENYNILEKDVKKIKKNYEDIMTSLASEVETIVFEVMKDGFHHFNESLDDIHTRMDVLVDDSSTGGDVKDWLEENRVLMYNQVKDMVPEMIEQRMKKYHKDVVNLLNKENDVLIKEISSLKNILLREINDKNVLQEEIRNLKIRFTGYLGTFNSSPNLK